MIKQKKKKKGENNSLFICFKYVGICKQTETNNYRKVFFGQMRSLLKATFNPFPGHQSTVS
jgi:hypothetical protein